MATPLQQLDPQKPGFWNLQDKKQIPHCWENREYSTPTYKEPQYSSYSWKNGRQAQTTLDLQERKTETDSTRQKVLI